MWDRRGFIVTLGAGIIAPIALSPGAHSQGAVAQAPGDPFPLRIAAGAEARAKKAEIYDPAYVKLAYPMGDVPDDRGVCCDTVIRAFRHAGVDLQVEVHQDMKQNFSVYPKAWGLKRPDPNIDHRRVPNLETFFRRKGGAQTLSKRAADYLPGDIVSWRLTGTSLPHIGVVTRKKTFLGEPVVAHNIGAGTQEEACLFNWTMTGHFRFEAWA